MRNIGRSLHIDFIADVLREEWVAASCDIETCGAVRNAIESVTRELGDHMPSSAAARLLKYVTTGEWPRP